MVNVFSKAKILSYIGSLALSLSTFAQSPCDNSIKYLPNSDVKDRVTEQYTKPLFYRGNNRSGIRPLIGLTAGINSSINPVSSITNISDKISRVSTNSSSNTISVGQSVNGAPLIDFISVYTGVEFNIDKTIIQSRLELNLASGNILLINATESNYYDPNNFSSGGSAAFNVVDYSRIYPELDLEVAWPIDFGRGLTQKFFVGGFVREYDLLISTGVRTDDGYMRGKSFDLGTIVEGGVYAGFSFKNRIDKSADIRLAIGANFYDLIKTNPNYADAKINMNKSGIYLMVIDNLDFGKIFSRPYNGYYHNHSRR